MPSAPFRQWANINTQIFQNPLIKECSWNHIGIPALWFEEHSFTQGVWQIWVFVAALLESNKKLRRRKEKAALPVSIMAVSINPGGRGGGASAGVLTIRALLFCVQMMAPDFLVTSASEPTDDSNDRRGPKQGENRSIRSQISYPWWLAGPYTIILGHLDSRTRGRYLKSRPQVEKNKMLFEVRTYTSNLSLALVSVLFAVLVTAARLDPQLKSLWEGPLEGTPSPMTLCITSLFSNHQGTKVQTFVIRIKTGKPNLKWSLEVWSTYTISS